MNSKVSHINLAYKDKVVKGKHLIVTSELPVNIDKAWKEVQKSTLLEFISNGKVRFKPLAYQFPKHWKQNMTIKARMLIYGCIPFGGIHTIQFIKIDAKRFIILTNEKNTIVKIWNHKISMKLIDDYKIKYSDEIEIYAGILTNIVVKWAKSFYKHRQKRWQIIAKT